MLLGAGACRADVLELVNGDRITGQIQRVEGSRLVIVTDYAGEIKVDWPKIGALTTDGPVTVQLDDETRIYGKLTADKQTVYVRTGEGEETRTFEAKHVDAIYRGEMLRDKLGLSGRINAGLSQTSGNTKTSTSHVDAELIARKGRDRYTTGVLFNHSEDRDLETASNARFYAKYDHFFTKKWYGMVNTTAEHDRFKDLEFRNTAGAGLGYQAIESTRTNLAFEGGLDYVYTNYYMLPTEHYPAVRLALKFDQFVIPGRLQFFNTSEFYIGQGGDQPSFARTQTGLRLPIYANFLATLQYNVDWNEHPPGGLVHFDRMLLLSLGYHW